VLSRELTIWRSRRAASIGENFPLYIYPVAVLNPWMSFSPQDIPCGIINAIDYEAVRPEANVLSGYIISAETDKGIVGVKIELMDVTSHSKVGETATGRKGAFAFQSLPAGRYRLQASKKARYPMETGEFLVPRENLTILHLHNGEVGAYRDLSINCTAS
jgi:hypothetical protein